MWFEPPSVCRWETAEETKISERMENGFSNSDISTKIKRRLLKDRKVLEDFNMLNMPCGLDLYCLMQDFVVPRLPNGYEVRVGDKIVSRKSSSNRGKHCRLFSLVQSSFVAFHFHFRGSSGRSPH